MKLKNPPQRHINPINLINRYKSDQNTTLILKNVNRTL